MKIRNLAFAILLISCERLNPLLGGAHSAALEPQQQQQQQDVVVSPPTKSATAQESSQVGSRSKPDSSSRQDNRRPIWAIAHMVNSIRELDYRLKSGANAIEADVTFGRDGTPTHTYHGPPCDCWRHCHQQEALADFLAYIRAVSIDTAEGVGQNLTLLFLDLKLNSLDQMAKERAGRELAKAIVKYLYEPSRDETQPDEPLDELSKGLARARAQSFRLVLSVNHVNDIDFIRNFMHTLETTGNSSQLLSENIAFDVGMNDQLPMIETMWRKLLNNGPKLNLWQGDGYTNCLSPFYNLERLSSAIAKRDDPKGYPAKVYHWTIDLHDRLRESLLMGVDAIMTNHPERVVTVLREPAIAHDFRLATRADDPFRKLTRHSLGRRDETARFQRSANAPAGGLLSNLMDVLASWVNYFREIPFLSYPTTLMGRSSSTSAKQRPASRRRRPVGETKTVVLTPNRSQSPNVTEVILDNEPEYKVLTSTTKTTPTTTTTTTTTTTAAATSPATVKLTASTDQTQTTTSSASNNNNNNKAVDLNEAQVYTELEGPKWYTSLVSQLLVAWMRVVLPPPVHETL